MHLSANMSDPRHVTSIELTQVIGGILMIGPAEAQRTGNLVRWLRGQTPSDHTLLRWLRGELPPGKWVTELRGEKWR
jgi:hypothetical protein